MLQFDFQSKNMGNEDKKNLEPALYLSSALPSSFALANKSSIFSAPTSVRFTPLEISALPLFDKIPAYMSLFFESSRMIPTASVLPSFSSPAIASTKSESAHVFLRPRSSITTSERYAQPAAAPANPAAQPAAVAQVNPVAQPAAAAQVNPAAQPAAAPANPAAQPAAAAQVNPVVQPAAAPVNPIAQPAAVEPAIPVAQPTAVEPAIPIAQPAAVEPAIPVAQPAAVVQVNPVAQPAAASAIPIVQPAAVAPAIPVAQPAAAPVNPMLFTALITEPSVPQISSHTPAATKHTSSVTDVSKSSAILISEINPIEHIPVSSFEPIMHTFVKMSAIEMLIPIKPTSSATLLLPTPMRQTASYKTGREQTLFVVTNTAKLSAALIPAPLLPIPVKSMMPAAAKPLISKPLVSSVSTPLKTSEAISTESPEIKKQDDATVSDEKDLSESDILDPTTLAHLSTPESSPESSEIFLSTAAVNPAAQPEAKKVPAVVENVPVIPALITPFISHIPAPMKHALFVSNIPEFFTTLMPVLNDVEQPTPKQAKIFHHRKAEASLLDNTINISQSAITHIDANKFNDLKSSATFIPAPIYTSLGSSIADVLIKNFDKFKLANTLFNSLIPTSSEHESADSETDKQTSSKLPLIENAAEIPVQNNFMPTAPVSAESKSAPKQVTDTLFVKSLTDDQQPNVPARVPAATAVNPIVATPAQHLSATHTFDPFLFITPTKLTTQRVDMVTLKMIDLSWLVQLHQDMQLLKDENELAIRNLKARNKGLENKRNAVPGEYEKEFDLAQKEVSKYERLYNNHPKTSKKLLIEKADLQQNINDHLEELNDSFSALKNSFSKYAEHLKQDIDGVTTKIYESELERYECNQEIARTKAIIHYLETQQTIKNLQDELEQGDASVVDEITEQTTYLHSLKTTLMTQHQMREDYFETLKDFKKSLRFNQKKKTLLEDDLAKIETTLNRLREDQVSRATIYENFQEKLFSILESQKLTDTTVEKLTKILSPIKKSSANRDLFKSVNSIKEKIQTFNKMSAELEQVNLKLTSKEQQLDVERVDLEEKLTAAETALTSVEQKRDLEIFSIQDQIEKNVLLMAKYQKNANNLDQFNDTYETMYRKMSQETTPVSQLVEKHTIYSANLKAIRSYFEIDGLLHDDNESLKIWKRYEKNVYDYPLKDNTVVKARAESEDQDTLDLVDKAILTNYEKLPSNVPSFEEELTSAREKQDLQNKPTTLTQRHQTSEQEDE